MKFDADTTRTLEYAGIIVGVGLILVYTLYPGVFFHSSKQAAGSFKIFETFPGGAPQQVYPPPIPGVVSCGSCGGGGSGLTFSPSVAVSFSGDTITGGSCSGTVSFNSVGGVQVPSSSVTGVGAASTSPMSCPMNSVSVPFSDFSSLPSGTYTLTATLASSGAVTFTNGGPDSGVSYAANSVSASVTLTVSGGTVTGVSGSV